jgi:hypothetical protein
MFASSRSRTQIEGFGRYILRKFNIAQGQSPTADARELLLQPSAAHCRILTIEQKKALLTGCRYFDGQDQSTTISPGAMNTTPEPSSEMPSREITASAGTSFNTSPPKWQLDHLYSDATMSDLLAQFTPDDGITRQLESADITQDEFSLLNFPSVALVNQFPQMDSDPRQDFLVPRTDDD